MSHKNTSETHLLTTTPDIAEDLKSRQSDLDMQSEELRHTQMMTETALRRFAQLFATLPLPALVVDGLGMVQECNDRAAELFNLPASQLHAHYLQHLVHKKAHGRLHELLAQAQRHGQAMMGDMDMQTAGRRRFIADMHVASLPDLSAAAEHFIVTVVDQTQAIAQLQALEAGRRHFMVYFESSPVGMAATSVDKGWIEVNEKLCQMLGYGRDELTRMTWLELTHPDDMAADLALFNRLLANEIPGYEMDKRFIRRDGSVLDSHIAVSCLRTTDGAVDYCVAIVEDVGIRKQAERTLMEQDLVLKRQALLLRERVKELQAIYAISRAAHQLSDRAAFFGEVLALIPPGMLYPDDTEVSIRLQDKQFDSPGAQNMLAALRSDIQLDRDIIGEIVVGYGEPHDDLDNGPFFNEEQQFVEGCRRLDSAIL